MSPFLYQSSFGVEWLILGLLVVSLFVPRFFVGLAVALVFVRLDERFPLGLPLLGLTYILLFANIALRFRTVLRHRFEKDDKILLLFVGVILVETLLFNRGALFSILKDFAIGFVFYLSMIVFLGDKKGLRVLNYVLLISSALICLEPLYYNFTEPTGSPVLRAFVGLETRLAAWGMWNNANETSFIALLGVANILILLTAEKIRLKALLLYSPLLVMFILTTVMTASRTGIVCVLVLVLFGGLFAKRQVLRAGAIALLVVGMVMAPTYLAMRTDMEGSSDARDDLRYIGKQIFLHNPVFGVGYGESRYGHGTRGQPLHNTYLQAFAETGFFGGVLFLLFFYMNGRKLVRRLRHGSGDRDARMANGVLLGFFVSACLYFFFGNQLLTIMFFTIFALVKVVVAAKEQEEGEKGAEPAIEKGVPELKTNLSA